MPSRGLPPLPRRALVHRACSDVLLCSGRVPGEKKHEWWWRTRSDPFDGVWEADIEPLPLGDPKSNLKAHCLDQNITFRK